MGLYLQHSTLTSGLSGDGLVVAKSQAPRTEVKHLLFCCKLWKSVSCIKSLCFCNFTCCLGLLLPVPSIRMYLSAGSRGRLWGPSEMWVTQARGTVWAPGPSRPPASPASWCHPLPEPQAAGTGSLPEGTGPVVCSGRCVGREASQGGTALTQRGSVDAHRPAVPARRGSQAPSQDRTAGPGVPIASLDCPACAAESGGGEHRDSSPQPRNLCRPTPPWLCSRASSPGQL